MTRAAVLVAAATALAYLASLGGAFQYDDYNVIVNYPTVHSWAALAEGAAHGVRALLKATYVLNWTLSEEPFGFLVVNITLHVLNAVLVLLVGRTLFEKHPEAALAAALLFALHPAQTEAVSYISGRSASLVATFYLGALLLHLRGVHRTYPTLLFVLALATKETAVTFPVAALLCDLARGKLQLRRTLPYWLVLCAAALVLLLAPRYQEFIAYGFSKRGLVENLITQVAGVSYLVSRLVGLHGYNIDPALPTLTAVDGVLAFEAASLLALFLLGVFSFRQRPWIGFGVLWFFLQLAPTNSIVPRVDVANDRQLYLACWGLFLAICIQVERAGLVRSVCYGLSVAIAATFAAASIHRQMDYWSEIALWEASVRESPWNSRAHNNLGYAYYLAGRRVDARREMETALLFDPKNEKARANLSLLDSK